MSNVKRGIPQGKKWSLQRHSDFGNNKRQRVEVKVKHVPARKIPCAHFTNIKREEDTDRTSSVLFESTQIKMKEKQPTSTSSQSHSKPHWRQSNDSTQSSELECLNRPSKNQKMIENKPILSEQGRPTKNKQVSKRKSMIRALLRKGDIDSSSSESDTESDGDMNDEINDINQEALHIKERPIMHTLRNNETVLDPTSNSKEVSENCINPSNKEEVDQSSTSVLSTSKLSRQKKDEAEDIDAFIKDLSPVEANFLKLQVSSAQEFLEVDPNIWAKALHQSWNNPTSTSPAPPTLIYSVSNDHLNQYKKANNDFSLEFCKGIVQSWTLRAKYYLEREIIHKNTDVVENGEKRLLQTNYESKRHDILDPMYGIVDTAVIPLLKEQGILYIQQFLSTDIDVLGKIYNSWIFQRVGKKLLDTVKLREKVKQWKESVKLATGTQSTMDETRENHVSSNLILKEKTTQKLTQTKGQLKQIRKSYSQVNNHTKPRTKDHPAQQKESKFKEQLETVSSTQLPMEASTTLNANSIAIGDVLKPSKIQDVKNGIHKGKDNAKIETSSHRRNIHVTNDFEEKKEEGSPKPSEQPTLALNSNSQINAQTESQIKEQPVEKKGRKSDLQPGTHSSTQPQELLSNAFKTDAISLRDNLKSPKTEESKNDANTDEKGMAIEAANPIDYSEVYGKDKLQDSSQQLVAPSVKQLTDISDNTLCQQSKSRTESLLSKLPNQSNVKKQVKPKRISLKSMCKLNDQASSSASNSSLIKKKVLSRNIDALGMELPIPPRNKPQNELSNGTAMSQKVMKTDNNFFGAKKKDCCEHLGSNELSISPTLQSDPDILNSTYPHKTSTLQMSTQNQGFTQDKDPYKKPISWEKSVAPRVWKAETPLKVWTGNKPKMSWSQKKDAIECTTSAKQWRRNEKKNGWNSHADLSASKSDWNRSVNTSEWDSNIESSKPFTSGIDWTEKEVWDSNIESIDKSRIVNEKEVWDSNIESIDKSRIVNEKEVWDSNIESIDKSRIVNEKEVWDSNIESIDKSRIVNEKEVWDSNVDSLDKSRSSDEIEIWDSNIDSAKAYPSAKKRSSSADKNVWKSTIDSSKSSSSAQVHPKYETSMSTSLYGWSNSLNLEKEKKKSAPSGWVKSGTKSTFHSKSDSSSIIWDQQLTKNTKSETYDLHSESKAFITDYKKREEGRILHAGRLDVIISRSGFHTSHAGNRRLIGIINKYLSNYEGKDLENFVARKVYKYIISRGCSFLFDFEHGKGYNKLEEEKAILHMKRYILKNRENKRYD